MNDRPTIKQALEKMFGWEHRKALGGARWIANLLARKAREQIQDLHSDLKRYQGEWREKQPKSNEPRFEWTLWCCKNDQCDLDKVILQHRRPVSLYRIAHNLYFHEELTSPCCPHCGTDLTLKRGLDELDWSEG